MSPNEQLDEFVRQWRRRLNGHRLLLTVGSGAAGAALGMVVVAMTFVLRGHAVEPIWLLLPAGAGVVLAGAWYAAFRLSPEQAARHADGAFDLKQGLTSSRAFGRQGRTGGVYALQSGHTADCVQQVDPGAVSMREPWRRSVVAIVAAAAAIWLCTFTDSPAVAGRKVEARQTEEKTAEIKEYLSEVSEQLEQELNDDEKELFAKSRLAEMVEQLEATTDRKEALRQYARIEKKLRDTARKLSTKSDEKFASQMAIQLAKGKDTRELGKTLAARKYRQAAKDMQKLSQKKTGDRLDQAAHQLGKLRQATTRMRQASQEMGKNPSDLKDRADALSESVEQLSESLDESQLSKCEDGQCEDGQCEAKKLAKLAKLGERQGDANDRLAKLGKGLGDLEARAAFLQKLKEMRKKLGQCQGYVVGQQVCLVNDRGIGQSEDGSMTNTTREQTDKTLATQVDPQMGQGPSQIAVEDAADGAGTASVSGRTRQWRFRAQVESLVRREDVPADVKDGVKNYFEIIHEDEDDR